VTDLPKVTVGPAGMGHTALAIEWLIHAPQDRAIVVAYTCQQRELLARVVEAADRKAAVEDNAALVHAVTWWARRVLTVQQVRDGYGSQGWKPQLWVDDALEIVHQHLRLGSGIIAGASIKSAGTFVPKHSQPAAATVADLDS
jgi:hypothetical protein